MLKYYRSINTVFFRSNIFSGVNFKFNQIKLLQCQSSVNVFKITNIVNYCFLHVHLQNIQSHMISNFYLQLFLFHVINHFYMDLPIWPHFYKNICSTLPSNQQPIILYIYFQNHNILLHSLLTYYLHVIPRIYLNNLHLIQYVYLDLHMHHP